MLSLCELDGIHRPESKLRVLCTLQKTNKSEVCDEAVGVIDEAAACIICSQWVLSYYAAHFSIRTYVVSA